MDRAAVEQLSADFREKVTVSAPFNSSRGSSNDTGKSGVDKNDGKYRFHHWRRHHSKDPARRGKVFYQNFKTLETSWIDPSTFTLETQREHEKKIADIQFKLKVVSGQIKQKMNELAASRMNVDEDKMSFVPADGLTLAQYEEHVTAGKIKGYAGRKYATAADKYADDYFVKFDQQTGRTTWHRVKDKATQVLQARVAASEEQKVLTSELTNLQTMETALLKSIASIGATLNTIKSVLVDNERQMERARLRREREESDANQRADRARIQRDLDRARREQERPFPWTSAQVRQLREVPQTLFVVDTNLWLDNADQCPASGVVSRLVHTVRGHHGRSAILVPRAVNNELDGLKKAPGACGRLAREASRTIERQRRFDQGSLKGEVTLVGQADWQLHRDQGMHQRPSLLRNDDSILNCCLFFHHDVAHILSEADWRARCRESKSVPPPPTPEEARKFQPRVFLVSRDRNFLQKAAFNGIGTLDPASRDDLTMQLRRLGLMEPGQVPPHLQKTPTHASTSRSNTPSTLSIPNLGRVSSSPPRMSGGTPVLAQRRRNMVENKIGDIGAVGALLQRSVSVASAPSNKQPSGADGSAGPPNRQTPSKRLITALLTPPDSIRKPNPNRRALSVGSGASPGSAGRPLSRSQRRRRQRDRSRSRSQSREPSQSPRGRGDFGRNQSRSQSFSRSRSRSRSHSRGRWNHNRNVSGNNNQRPGSSQTGATPQVQPFIRLRFVRFAEGGGRWERMDDRAAGEDQLYGGEIGAYVAAQNRGKAATPQKRPDFRSNNTGNTAVPYHAHNRYPLARTFRDGGAAPTPPALQQQRQQQRVGSPFVQSASPHPPSPGDVPLARTTRPRQRTDSGTNSGPVRNAWQRQPTLRSRSASSGAKRAPPPPPSGVRRTASDETFDRGRTAPQSNTNVQYPNASAPAVAVGADRTWHALPTHLQP